jgi:crossover junction endodeoxyribonuclease RuvC
MIYIGIDPGLEGGIVAINSRLAVVAAVPMPTAKQPTHNEIDVAKIAALLTELRLDHAGDLLVAIETLPYGRPGQRGVASAQTMGVNYGMLRGCLETMGIPYFLVGAQRWQKEVCPGSGDPKLRSIAFCKKALPALDLTPGAKKKPHDGMADAACIAVWMRKQEGEKT